MSTETQSNTQRYIGQVKWFNNRAGYGFITMTDESGIDKDVFAHYSTIKMEQSQYKFLVQGEYVEFELSTSVNEVHEFQATNITGIKGGSLMCENRQQPRGPVRHYRRNNAPSRERRDHESNDGFERVERKRSNRVTK